MHKNAEHGMRAAKVLRSFCAVFGSILILGCGQEQEKGATSSAENLSKEKVKETEKLPAARLRQAGQTLSKAASVEQELAKKAEENNREIETESK
ncbi:MAG TPA: hypothetical protein VEG25_06540 [Burkholderiales bacterium]|nr:hypothetical protein [Burkholderiales bacterium]